MVDFLSGTAMKILKKATKVSDLYKKYRDMDSSTIVERYGEFAAKTRKYDFHFIEQLTPYIDVPFKVPESTNYALNKGVDSRASELLKLVPPIKWGYYMPLSPNHSTLGGREVTQEIYRISRYRSEYRLNFIWSGLEMILNTSLRDMSVLDMACNWGGFAVEAKLRGVQDVSAFDIREDNIYKAKLLANHFDISNINFETKDLFQYEPNKKFDIVLNLGLMYHLSQPFEMMKKTYELTQHVAVIDTIVHREPVSGFILGPGSSITHATTAVGVELHPTYRALLDLTRLVGFRYIVELKGLPQTTWTDFSKDIYSTGVRRCIVAFK